VTTHSREFLTAVEPRELWTISRRPDGFAQVNRACDDDLVKSMLGAGANLGALWSEGYLVGADPEGLE
jgi:hypothetical protein